MRTQQLETTLITKAIQKIPHRNAKLFSDFLPQGYRSLALAELTKDALDETHFLKLQLGILITYLDDFADNPQLIDPDLIDDFFSQGQRLENKHTFAYELKESIFSGIQTLPNHSLLHESFCFDFRQLGQAFHYALLLQKTPTANNARENRNYLSHNMGISLALTFDLMALNTFHIRELGSIRALFAEMQEISRIMNVLMSFEREERELDPTSEIMSTLHSPSELRIKLKNLQKEKEYRLLELERNLPHLQSFDSQCLFKRFLFVNRLHSTYTGVL